MYVCERKKSAYFCRAFRGKSQHAVFQFEPPPLPSPSKMPGNPCFPRPGKRGDGDLCCVHPFIFISEAEEGEEEGEGGGLPNDAACFFTRLDLM